MITYSIASTLDELQQILALQQKNIIPSISKEEKETEGFVTVEHDLEILKKMNDLEPHIIAKDQDKVVGYALSMVQACKNDIEVLKPMFERIDALPDTNPSYMVMGQVCIAKAYRKKGIFKALYHTMKSRFSSKYDVLITEVAQNNTRSLQAHYAVGFTDMLVYNTEQTTWHIVQWDWRQ